MTTDSNGAVRSRDDYLPFGEEIGTTGSGRSSVPGYSSSTDIHQRFTSKERDTETGLDYSINRYYSSTQGRFTSPDPTLLSVNGFSPQSWNRYNYVMNNPLVYVDPLGLWALYAEDVYKTKKNKMARKQKSMITQYYMRERR
ncbi:MAG TPA: RHS repeat-associated core domain-containing protein [Blastocatellia bacterium]|nr:RHS repeat-associated core domain-containing protein [Blastocatellia bacterium]